MKRVVLICTLPLVFAVVLASSALAYPSARLAPIKGDIKFSHKLHVQENSVECATCHSLVDSSQLASDKNLPPMDVCGQCHPQISEDTSCGMCHYNNVEPSALDNPARPILFSHASHIGRKTPCETCHAGVVSSKEPVEADYPKMEICMDCHNGSTAPSRCELCHEKKITLADIHPTNWRVQHADAANRDNRWCQGCHQRQESCIACHRGDNTRGKIHSLNFAYSHGLEAKGKLLTCQTCHDLKLFCDDCHRNQGATPRMPLEHSLPTWKSTQHPQAAREDIENCQVCHDNGDPTCSRVGCHNDNDGIKGTNPNIHGARSEELKVHGPWHDDDGYFCFQCHTSTHQAGVGFCGYCHGND